MEPSQQNQLKTLYDQLCESYHKVDDFRAKLLGFLPLASGAVIFTLMDINKDGLVGSHLVEIGLFGVLATFGLLTYELKGIQKCTCFIARGQELEKKMLEGGGQFTILNEDRSSNWFASEPIASAIVYATVLAAWLYLACKDIKQPGGLWLSGAGWVITASWVVVFWKFYSKPSKQMAGEGTG